MKVLKKIFKRVMFPNISNEVQTEIDKENRKRIRVLSLSACVVEILITVSIYFKTSTMTPALMACVLSAFLFGIIHMCSRQIIVTNEYDAQREHKKTVLLAAVFFTLMIVQSVIVARNSYLSKTQMSPFFISVLCFVCFLTFHPVISCILILAAYGGFYAAMYFWDGAATIDPFRFFLLAVLSAAGMITRCFQQIKTSQKNAALSESVQKHKYDARHDALTGVRNRAAFKEDAPEFLKQPIVVVMSDIDYFKEINDTYGHPMGDLVLREVGKYIKQCFPGCTAYRYGGDEFLFILQNAKIDDVQNACKNYRGFTIKVLNCILDIRLSYGITSGTAENIKGLNALVSEADIQLYRIKRESHSKD